MLKLTRQGRERPFTLIELLIVTVLIGVLVAIIVPSYLSARNKAAVAAGEANVRLAIPAAESYLQDAVKGNGSYDGISGAELRLQTPGIDSNLKAGSNAARDAYCLADTASGRTYHYRGGRGGAGRILAGPCPSGYAMRA